jgi:hypothetical protein
MGAFMTPGEPTMEELRKLSEAGPEGPLVYQEQSDAYTHIIRGPGFFLQFEQDTTGRAEAKARLIAASVNLVRRMLSDEGLEKMARAYDAEDSAQRGEPDYWSIPFDDQYAKDVWVLERTACVAAALRVLIEGVKP